MSDFADLRALFINASLTRKPENSHTRLLLDASAAIMMMRLYAMSGELNNRGQSIYYNKVAGAVITGNEDGVKHVAMTIAFAPSRGNDRNAWKSGERFDFENPSRMIGS